MATTRKKNKSTTIPGLVNPPLTPGEKEPHVIIRCAGLPWNSVTIPLYDGVTIKRGDEYGTFHVTYLPKKGFVPDVIVPQTINAACPECKNMGFYATESRGGFPKIGCHSCGFMVTSKTMDKAIETWNSGDLIR